MPEWTIQKAKFITNVGTTDKESYKGRVCIQCDDQLWADFSLGYKKIIVKVNSILDNNGKIISNISEEVVMETQTLNLPSDVMRPASFSIHYNDYNVLIFPRDFIKTYGLRTNEYVDLIITGISYGGSLDTAELIYPKRFIRGQMDIQPSGTTSQEIGFVEPFLEQSITGEFYNDLIEEINRTYSYELSRSTAILIRTLFENLVIDLLRTKFTMKNVEIFFNKERKQFHDFSALIGTLRKNASEYTPFTAVFDAKFFEYLELLRDDGNSSAHTLDNYLDYEKLKENKKKINHYLKAIDHTLILMRKSS